MVNTLNIVFDTTFGRYKQGKTDISGKKGIAIIDLFCYNNSDVDTKGV